MLRYKRGQLHKTYDAKKDPSRAKRLAARTRCFVINGGNCTKRTHCLAGQRGRGPPARPAAARTAWGGEAQAPCGGARAGLAKLVGLPRVGCRMWASSRAYLSRYFRPFFTRFMTYQDLTK